jgi:hypothetical protein
MKQKDLNVLLAIGLAILLFFAGLVAWALSSSGLIINPPQ